MQAIFVKTFVGNYILYFLTATTMEKIYSWISFNSVYFCLAYLMCNMYEV